MSSRRLIEYCWDEDEQLFLCLRADDDLFQAGEGVTQAAGPLNAIQFNFPLGHFDGEANFTWVDGIGQYIQTINPGATTIPLSTGLHIDTAVSGAGTFTNYRGLLIEDQTGIGSTESYNIISNGTTFRFDPHGDNSGVYPGRTRGGNLFVNHTAVGNYADIDFVRGFPGDPLQQFVDHERAPLVVNEFFNDPVSENNFGFGFNLNAVHAMYGGITCINNGPIWSWSGLDQEIWINTQSTGNFQNVAGLSYFVVNNGQGNIGGLPPSTGSGGLAGGLGFVNNTPSSGFFVPAPGTVNFIYGLNGTVYTWGKVLNFMTAMYGLCKYDTGSGANPLDPIPIGATFYADQPAFFSGTVTNCYGVFIADHSGIGSTASENIHSFGANSFNYFEGFCNTGGTIVGSLPAPSAYLKGMRYYVTNALNPVFGSPVAGGGGVTIPVFCDGTNWIVG